MAQSRKAFITALIGLLLMQLISQPAAAQGATIGPVIYLPLVSNGITNFDGTLSNGGEYLGAGGLGLGALANSLSAPITVSITSAAVPGLALPAHVQAVSAYYQIAAGSNVEISPAEPFILAVPVPSGANTANLAVALLQSSDGFFDINAAATEWTFLDGKYDPAKNLFLTTLTSLTQAGETIALVEHPDLASPSNAVRANCAPQRRAGGQAV